MSLLSASSVTVVQRARLVGHTGINVTELIYCKQIRPVIDLVTTRIAQTCVLMLQPRWAIHH